MDHVRRNVNALSCGYDSRHTIKRGLDAPLYDRHPLRMILVPMLWHREWRALACADRLSLPVVQMFAWY